MQMKRMSEIFGHLAMIGQLGLSLIMPLLMCLFACYLLCSKLSVGAWVYIPGFILGLGGSMMTAYKVYLAVLKKESKKKSRSDNEISFNKHI